VAFFLQLQIKKFLWIIGNIKNWPLWIAFHFKFSLGEKTFYFRNGLRFLVTRGDFWSLREIFQDKMYTKEFDIHDNDIIIDIGANIGAFSVFAGNFAKNVKVLAYEPAPDAFSRLLKNIRANNLEENVMPFKQAVAGSAGERSLFFQKNSTGSSFLEDHNSKVDDVLVVDAITLKDVFEQNQIKKCHFLKMDCEGAEYEILLNAPENILSRIGKIALEYHRGYKELKVFLERNGFLVICPKPSPGFGMLYATNKN